MTVWRTDVAIWRTDVAAWTTDVAVWRKIWHSLEDRCGRRKQYVDLYVKDKCNMSKLTDLTTANSFIRRKGRSPAATSCMLESSSFSLWNFLFSLHCQIFQVF